ncbi:hypothetical protein HK096_000103, partial [Nowakowskiella sp. JEL0078]
MSAITISTQYGYVLLLALAINLQIHLTGMSIGAQRRKHGVKYPDMGNGRHAAKLSDEAWTEFNNYQRVHYNYVENATQILTLILTAGLFMPKTSAAIGVVYMVP